MGHGQWVWRRHCGQTLPGADNSDSATRAFEEEVMADFMLYKIEVNSALSCSPIPMGAPPIYRHAETRALLDRRIRTEISRE